MIADVADDYLKGNKKPQNTEILGNLKIITCFLMNLNLKISSFKHL